MFDVPLARFEELVAVALDAIPDQFAQAVDNVAFLVEEDSPGGNLLGLYQGVPLRRRGNRYGTSLPDRITLYRRAICAACTSEEEVGRLVYETIVHEVGHYFGMTDARLRELGW